MHRRATRGLTRGWVDHLWQSTAFAVVAGLAVLAFRRNRARVRYALWFAASAKFLVPLSVLPVIATPAWVSLRVGVAWLGLWACGFVVIASARLRAWRRVRSLVRASRPLTLPCVALPPHPAMRSAPGLLEPGVVGWRRPVLLMPADIDRHLSEPELETVVAHELCHVQRRDNLTAAAHILTEAIFWFHPLVWWIGTRLVVERERACDEYVLDTDERPLVYAQAILNVCRRYVTAPVACVAGVGGSGVRARIEAILRNDVGQPVGVLKQALVTVAVVALVVLPIAGDAGHLGYLAAAGQATPAPWRDPSPHQVRVVTVDTSVKLETLDWGGTGRPLLFVGCYLSAHVYDDIAPKLTDRFHVYAITRRGVGASDRPATGYDPQRRADDVLEVITALGLQKPILVGNSCGGDILHALGSQHPDRLGGLVYLDAAEDPTLTAADYTLPPVDRANLPARVSRPTAPVRFPEAEQRLLDERPIDPAIRKAIVEDNRVRPAYAKIRVPVLAVYRSGTLEQTLEEFPPANEVQRAAVIQGHAARRAYLEKWQRDLRAGVPTARIVEIAGADLYMFLSHEAEIIRELKAFSDTLK